MVIIEDLTYGPVGTACYPNSSRRVGERSLWPESTVLFSGGEFWKSHVLPSSGAVLYRIPPLDSQTHFRFGTAATITAIKLIAFGSPRAPNQESQSFSGVGS